MISSLAHCVSVNLVCYVGACVHAWLLSIGGIVQHHCSEETLDHAVVIVGYDMTGRSLASLRLGVLYVNVLLYFLTHSQ